MSRKFPGANTREQVQRVLFWFVCFPFFFCFVLRVGVFCLFVALFDCFVWRGNKSVKVWKEGLKEKQVEKWHWKRATSRKGIQS